MALDFALGLPFGVGRGPTRNIAELLQDIALIHYLDRAALLFGQARNNSLDVEVPQCAGVAFWSQIRRRLVDVRVAALVTCPAKAGFVLFSHHHNIGLAAVKRAIGGVRSSDGQTP